MGSRAQATVTSVPQVFPYQGSKRALAPRLLPMLPRDAPVLWEPCGGSAALSLAARSAGLGARVVIGDVWAPLVALWRQILADPAALAARYAARWEAARSDPRGAYAHAREQLNRTGDPDALLYVLNRCVKGAVRFNARGEFNQSADHRRLGARPTLVRARLVGASALLGPDATAAVADLEATLGRARPEDVVFLDPPYAGVSSGADRRYRAGFDQQALVDVLRLAVRRDLSVLLTYDGRRGEQSFAAPLPDDLGLACVELPAGRSAQSTLLGRAEQTVELAYLTPALQRRIRTPRS
jgi:DNA adenine methylase